MRADVYHYCLSRRHAQQNQPDLRSPGLLTVCLPSPPHALAPNYIHLVDIVHQRYFLSSWNVQTGLGAPYLARLTCAQSFESMSQPSVNKTIHVGAKCCDGDLTAMTRRRTGDNKANGAIPVLLLSH